MHFMPHCATGSSPKYVLVCTDTLQSLKRPPCAPLLMVWSGKSPKFVDVRNPCSWYRRLPKPSCPHYAPILKKRRSSKAPWSQLA